MAGLLPKASVIYEGPRTPGGDTLCRKNPITHTFLLLPFRSAALFPAPLSLGHCTLSSSYWESRRTPSLMDRKADVRKTSFLFLKAASKPTFLVAHLSG